MTIKVDKYPNKDDYKPFADKSVPDEMFELPLSDPSQSNTTNTYRTYHFEEESDRISAFAENKNLGHE